MKLINELIEVLVPKQTLTLRFGITEIKIGPKTVTISHLGSMRSRETDIEDNVNHILKGNYFKRLKSKGKYHTTREHNTHSDPKYSYILDIPRKDFDAIINISKI